MVSIYSLLENTRYSCSSTNKLQLYDLVRIYDSRFSRTASFPRGTRAKLKTFHQRKNKKSKSASFFFGFGQDYFDLHSFSLGSRSFHDREGRTEYFRFHQDSIFWSSNLLDSILPDFDNFQFPVFDFFLQPRKGFMHGRVVKFFAY